jgi:dUTPase
MDKERTISFVYNTDKQNFVKQAQSTQTPLFSISHEKPTVRYQLSRTAEYLPKICPESNGLDIPLQETQYFQSNELKKVNLHIRFILPKHYCALLMNKLSARLKYNVQIQLGLIDVGYSDTVQAVIQKKKYAE